MKGMSNNTFLGVTWRAKTTSAWKATWHAGWATLRSPKISDHPRNCPILPWRPDDENYLPPVFEKADINAIPGINLYPVDSTISFPCTYLPDRDLWSFIRWIAACVAGGISGEWCCFLAAVTRAARENPSGLCRQESTPPQQSSLFQAFRSWGQRKKMCAEKNTLFFSRSLPSRRTPLSEGLEQATTIPLATQASG